MPEESSVQVQPDLTGTGSEVGTIQLKRVTSDVETVVEIQAVALTDREGAVLMPLTEDTGRAILSELKHIRRGIGLLVDDPLLIVGED